VEKHGGGIKVESEVSEGSCFRVYLPATKEKERDASPASIAEPGGGETIMIVDDNPDFLKVMTISLRKLGYNIITARSGSEAVEILAAGDSEIDLVILDVIMKGLSGSETFYRLRKLKPDLLVILCTGYSHNSITEKLLSSGASGFIQKPFNIENLTMKIRGVLA